MDNREAILEAAVSLVREHGDSLDDITVRDICERAGVGLGLVNYHFGSKDRLMEQCFDRIAAHILADFRAESDATADLAPFVRIDRLCNKVSSLLFANEAVSRAALLSGPSASDEGNMFRSVFSVLLPLLTACRPDWSQSKTERRTFILVSSILQSFLRYDAVARFHGVDLRKPGERSAFFTQLLRDTLELGR